jgi:hypothetical protein
VNRRLTIGDRGIGGAPKPAASGGRFKTRFEYFPLVKKAFEARFECGWVASETRVSDVGDGNLRLPRPMGRGEDEEERRKSTRSAHVPRENRVDFKKIFRTNIPNFGIGASVTCVTDVADTCTPGAARQGKCASNALEKTPGPSALPAVAVQV